LERELVPMLQSEGLGLMVWSPLAGGLLSGKYALGEGDKTEGEGRRSKLDFPRVDKKLAFDLVEAMRPMAESRGVTVSAIAIAWLLHQEAVSTVIVGARRAAQLAENLAASDVELTADELARLDPLGTPEPEYPGWAIASQTTRHGFRVSPRRQAK
jgi:aryl-alcohol dehydrogenase-like predicted oxidoreductase